jgi:hypothetical protein
LIQQTKERRVRGFGEMAALLCGQGFKSATVKLEEFWNSFTNNEAFCISCEYPKCGCRQDLKISIDDICRRHSEVTVEWNKHEQEANNTIHPTSSIA